MKPFKPVGRKRAGDEIDNAPKGKKTKAAKEADGDGYGGEFWEVSEFSVLKTSQKADDWKQLGRTRRVQFNEFMGKKLVDIREFYEKNGETLPAKKVSLPNGGCHSSQNYGELIRCIGHFSQHCAVLFAHRTAA